VSQVALLNDLINRSFSKLIGKLFTLQKKVILPRVTCRVKLVLAIRKRAAYTVYYNGWHPVLGQPSFYLTAEFSAQRLPF
jgi:hypothetical protein